MMSVVDRLAFVANDDPVARWFPALHLSWRDPMLRRIDDAGSMLSLSHGYKRMSTRMAAALKTVIPELAWFQKYPSSADGTEAR